MSTPYEDFFGAPDPKKKPPTNKKGQVIPVSTKQTKPVDDFFSTPAPAGPNRNKFGSDVSDHSFNPLNTNNVLAQKQPSTSVARNFISAIPSAFAMAGKTAFQLPKQTFYDPLTHPSAGAQTIEANLPDHSAAEKILKTLSKPVVRFFLAPGTEGFGQDLGNKIAGGFKEKTTPLEDLHSFLNAAQFSMAVTGLLYGGSKSLGNRLASKTGEIQVTPKMIREVIAEDPLALKQNPVAKAVLQSMAENDTGFKLNLQRPAGGARQAAGEFLGGTAGKTTSIIPDGQGAPQLTPGQGAGIQPFAHEIPPSADIPTYGAPFAHEANIGPAKATVEPFTGSSIDPLYQKVGTKTGSQNTLIKGLAYPFDSIGEKLDSLKQLPSDATVEDARKMYHPTPEQIAAGKNYGIDIPTTEKAFSNIQSNQPSPTIMLNAGINPGVDQFIAQDVIPKAKGAARSIGQIFREITDAVNPTGSAPKGALDAIMSAKGGFEQKVFRTERVMRAVERTFDKMPENQRLQFMQDIEEGNDIDPAHGETAKLYRQRLDNAYKAIEKYKDIPFIENFFPHFWKKFKDGETIVNATRARNLEGSKSFLKKRVFATIKEGMDKGYSPVTTNPEKLMQMYEENVAKFVMAQEMAAGLKAQGMWQYIPEGKPVPDGYAFIKDEVARVYFPKGTVRMPNGFEMKKFTSAGRYAAPTSVARLINNHLSIDLIMNTAIGRGLMATKNTLNALQLGFSAFHVTAEMLNSIMTGFDVSISEFSRGHILRAAKNAITAPLNPIIYAIKGRKFFNGASTKFERDIFTGGASFRSKQYYKNGVFDNFISNIRGGNYIGAILRSPLAAIEGVMRPLFSYYIPRLKVAAFEQLLSEELDRKGKQIAAGKITRETVDREVWNNIENRFGNINYDNLFWNKTFKSANMLAWRAVGWNLGTLREIGGAVTQDTYRAIKAPFKFERGQDGKYHYSGEMPDLTPKMRYTIAMLFTVAAVGGIYQYLHTGKWPDEIKDYFWPENGAKNANGDAERVQFPTYMKDGYGYSQSPIQTVANKMSPEAATIIELLQNRDYYGDMIRNPHDNLPMQLKQLGLFIGTQLTPFSITNAKKLAEDNADTEQKGESFLGITRAPQGVIDNPNIKKIKEALPDRGARTPEEKALANIKLKLRKRIQAGENVSYNEIIKAGAASDARGAKVFVTDAKKSPEERLFDTVPKRDREGLVDPDPTPGTPASRTRSSARSATGR